jgi:hypothetical protein
MTTAATGPGCGHSLEELDEYLRTGHSDLEPHLATCPECQAALSALKRLHELTDALIQDDINRAGTGDEPWLTTILDNLRLETRTGRTIPLTSSRPQNHLSQTEGSVIALIRTVGDTIDGATIGRCRLHGDLGTPGAEVRVDVNVAAFWGHPLPGLARTLRSRIFDALERHTELNITGIDITVTDIHAQASPAEASRP